MSGWQFEPYSALIGVVLSLTFVGLGYLFREPLLRGWQELQGLFHRLAGWVTAGAEERYRQKVARWAQEAHALARFGPLEALFLPDRLLPPPPHPGPEASTLFPPKPLPLAAALRGHPKLLLVGEPGSGRSTLLAYLALASVQQEPETSPGPVADRLPLYVPLSEEERVPGEDAAEDERLDRLVRKAIRAVGGSSGADTVLRQHLAAGAALVLVDGWEELEAEQQEGAAAWLAGAAEALPGNLWVIASPSRGYAPLVEAGFVPLRLEAWGRPELRTLLSRLLEILPEAEDRPSLRQAVDVLAQTLPRALSRLHISLRASLLLETGESPKGETTLFLRTAERLLEFSEEEAWIGEAACASLGRLALAAEQEQSSTITREEIEEALEAALAPHGERPPRVNQQAFQALTAPGSILISRAPGEFAFAHPLWQACFAAWQLAATSAKIPVGDELESAHWRPVLEFYAEIGQMESVLEAWLKQSDGLWRERLCLAARWAMLAPADAPWRNGIMALLARAFLGSSLPTQVRERLGLALVRTGDPAVALFLRQALQHTVEDVRAVAAQAMGWLGERADVDALVSALEDQSERVQLTAVSALGDIGNPAAIRRLTGILMEGDDALRVEAARGLASAGEAGWDVLREAMEEEDFLVRRAAIYGLGELGTAWASEMLERAARDDEQWIVRSAAGALLGEEGETRSSSVPRPLIVSEMAWLNTWAAERGEGVGMGEAAFEPLLRALQEGELSVRRAAAHALGLAGRPEHATALRQAMGDPSDEVAHAAAWALEELARRYDLTI